MLAQKKQKTIREAEESVRPPAGASFSGLKVTEDMESSIGHLRKGRKAGNSARKVKVHLACPPNLALPHWTVNNLVRPSRQYKTVMTGYCPECYAFVVRPDPCDTAVCPHCNPIVYIPLEPYVKVWIRVVSDK